MVTEIQETNTNELLEELLLEMREIKELLLPEEVRYRNFIDDLTTRSIRYIESRVSSFENPITTKPFCIYNDLGVKPESIRNEMRKRAESLYSFNIWKSSSLNKYCNLIEPTDTEVLRKNYMHFLEELVKNLLV